MILTTGAWSHAEKMLLAAGGFSIAFLLLLTFILFNISDCLNNEQQRKNDLYYERLKNKRRKRSNMNDK